MRRAVCLTPIVSALILLLAPIAALAAEVKIDASIRYQTIDGLGTFAYAPGDGGILSSDQFADLYVKNFRRLHHPHLRRTRRLAQTRPRSRSPQSR